MADDDDDDEQRLRLRRQAEYCAWKARKAGAARPKKSQAVDIKRRVARQQAADRQRDSRKLALEHRIRKSENWLITLEHVFRALIKGMDDGRRGRMMDTILKQESYVKQLRKTYKRIHGEEYFTGYWHSKGRVDK
jgi:hypothetical protein